MSFEVQEYGERCRDMGIKYRDMGKEEKVQGYGEGYKEGESTGIWGKKERYRDMGKGVSITASATFAHPAWWTGLQPSSAPEA